MIPKALSHRPIINFMSCRIEVDAYLKKFARVVGEGRSVAFVLDLLHGYGSGLVDFQFEDVNIILGLHQDVHASVCGMTLHVDIKAHQLEKGSFGECVGGVMKGEDF